MNRSVFIVDDDRNVLAAYRRGLSRDFDVTTCDSPLAAVSKIAETSYAAIVSDMKMPEMNGLQFLQKAADVSPASQRIMLTGMIEDDVVEEINGSQLVFALLNKPCSRSILAETLERAIEHHNV